MGVCKPKMTWTYHFYTSRPAPAGRLLFIPAHRNNLIFAQTVYHMDQQVVPPNQLNIEISEEVAEGTYANLAIITHSHAEFVIDFVNVMPGTPKSKVKS